MKEDLVPTPLNCPPTHQKKQKKNKKQAALRTLDSYSEEGIRLSWPQLQVEGRWITSDLNPEGFPPHNIMNLNEPAFIFIHKRRGGLQGTLRNSVKTFAQPRATKNRSSKARIATDKYKANKFNLQIILYILSYSAHSSKNMYAFIKI